MKIFFRKKSSEVNSGRFDLRKVFVSSLVIAAFLFSFVFGTDQAFAQSEDLGPSAGSPGPSETLGPGADDDSSGSPGPSESAGVPGEESSSPGSSESAGVPGSGSPGPSETLGPGADDSDAEGLPSESAGVPEEEETPKDVEEDETVSPEDLGAKRARVLPNSLFHGFKRIGRTLKEVATFNPIKKAELRHRHANQELSEIKQLIDQKGVAGVSTAVVQRSMERYKKKIDSVVEASDKIKEKRAEDPQAVDRLLNDLTDKQIKKKKVFDRIGKDLLDVKKRIKLSGEEDQTILEAGTRVEQMLRTVETTKEKTAEGFTKVLVEVDENADAIGTRLIRVLNSHEGSDFKDLSNLAFLGEIEAASKRIEVEDESEILTFESAVSLAKKNSREHFEDVIRAKAPAVRAEQFGRYFGHFGSDEMELFRVIEDLKFQGNIPIDILDKLEDVKEEIVERYEDRMEIIDDPEMEDKYFDHFRSDDPRDIMILSDFSDRLRGDLQEFDRIREVQDESIEAFKKRFKDTESQNQATLFQELSRKMVENPSIETFKLLEKLEAEVQLDPAKRAFLMKLEEDARKRVEEDYKREGDRYLSRQITHNPEDMLIYDELGFSDEFRNGFVDKNVERFRHRVRDVERPEDFDEIYDRFQHAPREVIDRIKEVDPEFQQAFQYKFRRMEQIRIEEERERDIARLSLDYEERELHYQIDKVERDENEAFWRKMDTIEWDDFEQRNRLWDEKIKADLERMEKRVEEQKRIMQERTKLDPFGCDQICQEAQLAFLNQDLRHQKERLLSDMHREKNRIESERTQYLESNPLADKCDTPQQCEEYCLENREVRGCEWVSDFEKVCPLPSYWDRGKDRCVYPDERYLIDCLEGFYYDDRLDTCIEDPNYRPPTNWKDCGYGMRWNDFTASCEPDRLDCDPQRDRSGQVIHDQDGNVVYQDYCYRTECPRGFYWDNGVRDCVQEGHKECDLGYYFDFGTRRCESVQPKCGFEEYWDPGLRKCVYVSPVQCPVFDIMPCQEGYYREPARDENGCWYPGKCVPDLGPNICPTIYFEPCQPGYHREFHRSPEGCNMPGECIKDDFTDVCGDGICGFSEDRLSCPKDCEGEVQDCKSNEFNNFTGKRECNYDLCPQGCEWDMNKCAVGCHEKPKAYCGDGICDGPETQSNCSLDCGVEKIDCGAGGSCAPGDYCANYEKSWCCPVGTSVCSNGDCVSDPSQCSVQETCGDGICSETETIMNCPTDCYGAPGCGNGICEDNENIDNCATDCKTDACPANEFNDYIGNYACDYDACPKGCSFDESGCATGCYSMQDSCPEGWSYTPATDSCVKDGVSCGDATACLNCPMGSSGDTWCEWDSNGCPLGCKTGDYCNYNNVCDPNETKENCPTDCYTETDGWIKHIWYFYGGETETSYILDRTDSEYTSFVAGIDAKCKKSNHSDFYWLPGAGDDTNWQAFGIPNCPGDVVEVVDKCGNNVCEAGEDTSSCPADCTTQVQCPGNAYNDYTSGNHCSTSKCPDGCEWDSNNCPISCSSSSGDSCSNMPGWSYNPATDTCVKDGVSCGDATACLNCPMNSSGDTWCDLDDNGCPLGCKTSADACDFDGYCEPYDGETQENCASDCYGSSYCGDGTCDSNEDTSSCYADCGGTYPGDENSCPSFAYSMWDSNNVRYCKLNNAEKCDYNYPSYLTDDGSYTEANCPTAGYCGDGTCDSNEDGWSCPADCAGVSPYTCADDPNYCHSTTDCQNAGHNWCYFSDGTQHCQTSACPLVDICGDNVCSSTEDSSSCPGDCGALIQCGDNNTCAPGDWCADYAKGWCCPNGQMICSTGECVNSMSECPSSSYCGDGTCDMNEDPSSCFSDCGYSTICGDNICDPSEDQNSCPNDCITPTSCPDNGFNMGGGGYDCNTSACPSGCFYDNSTGCPVSCMDGSVSFVPYVQHTAFNEIDPWKRFTLTVKSFAHSIIFTTVRAATWF